MPARTPPRPPPMSPPPKDAAFDAIPAAWEPRLFTPPRFFSRSPNAWWRVCVKWWCTRRSSCPPRPANTFSGDVAGFRDFLLEVAFPARCGFWLPRFPRAPFCRWGDDGEPPRSTRRRPRAAVPPSFCPRLLPAGAPPESSASRRIVRPVFRVLNTAADMVQETKEDPSRLATERSLSGAARATTDISQEVP